MEELYLSISSKLLTVLSALRPSTHHVEIKNRVEVKKKVAGSNSQKKNKKKTDSKRMEKFKCAQEKKELKGNFAPVNIPHEETQKHVAFAGGSSRRKADMETVDELSKQEHITPAGDLCVEVQAEDRESGLES